MSNEIAMYILSAIILALGAISLLTQKLRAVDQEGKEVIIELPFFGKLRTNYPAVAFAFIGAGLAAFTYAKTCELNDQWVINGQFTAPESGTIDWTKGSVMIRPAMLWPNINQDGTFEIQGSIRRGVKFEDVVEQITYSNWCGGKYTARIMTKEEYNKHKAGEPSNLQNVDSTMRVYKPMAVDFIPEVQQ